MGFFSRTIVLGMIGIMYVVLCGKSAGAQDFQPAQKFVGLHHLAPMDPPPTPAVETPEKQVTLSAETPPPVLPVYKPLSVKESLVKIENLEKWPHLNEAALTQNNDDLQKLVHLIESDRGAVPPQGLFLAAKALSDKHVMELSALYYFVGQLRLSFDMARWPPQSNPDDVKRLAEDSKKTPDQAAPNRDTAPRINDPHQGVKILADSIGQPIIAWTMKDQSRMNTVITRVREWDASAPYAYQTGYEVGPPVPFETWGKLLDKTRNDYFSYLQTMIKAMEKVRN